MNTKEKLLNQTVKFYSEYNEQVAQGIGDSCYEFEIMKDLLVDFMEENAGLIDEEMDELLEDLTLAPYNIKEAALPLLKQYWNDAITEFEETKGQHVTPFDIEDDSWEKGFEWLYQMAVKLKSVVKKWDK